MDIADICEQYELISLDFPVKRNQKKSLTKGYNFWARQFCIDQVQILHEAVSILLHIDVIEKGMNSSILSSVISK